jgi:uncharacterized glyoxalase superfamily protein PhnB
MSEQMRSTLIPSLRYRNALAAIDWLCRAFGLTRNAVYMGEGDSVAHAQLTFGGGMIMLGSVDNGSEYGKLMVHPDEIGLRETRGIYLAVPDADAVYAMAKAAGAVMVFDIRDMDYGGRGFTCRDLEGYLWSVGSYDAWAEPAHQ